MRLFVAAASLFVSLNAAAQLTITEAVERAIGRSPSVAAAESETAAARAANAETRAARLPSLALGGTGTRFSDPAIATPIHGFNPLDLPRFDRTLLQSALIANYTLFDAGAREARIEESSGIASAAAAGTDAARQSAALRAISAYAAVLARATVVEAQDARLRALNAERDRVVQFEQAGRAPHVDLLRVEAAVAASEAERIAAAAALDEGERELARLLDVPADDVRAARLVRVEDPGDALPPRETLEQQANDSPPLRQARFRSIAQHQTIAAARSGRWPQVVANANQLSFATGQSVLANEWNAGLALRFSVFDGGANSARVARAASASKAAEDQFRNAQLEVGIALDRAIADFERARATLTSLAKAVDRNEEVARIEKLRLDNGAGTQTDYLRAEADLVAARSNLAAAQYGVVVSRAAIARITGVLDAQWTAARFGRKP